MFPAHVSIPFKRESVLQDYTASFQQVDALIVSIPFKRESVLQADNPSQFLVPWKEFQFPSNGKVYCKSKIRVAILKLQDVSIPFKRESVLQEKPTGNTH